MERRPWADPGTAADAAAGGRGAIATRAAIAVGLAALVVVVVAIARAGGGADTSTRVSVPGGSGGALPPSEHLLPPLPAASATADPDPVNRKIALLVGVEEYAPGTPEEFPRLHGPRRDVALASHVLQQRFGFAARNVHVLLDGEATHRNVVQTFHRELVQRAGPDTELLFWYCGHGSRIEDASGRDMHGLDSSFVLYDSRAEDPRGGLDFVDDQLGSLIQHLVRQRRGRITVVTDSCHSGGSVRGSLVSRTVPNGDRPLDRTRVRAFWPAEVPLLDDDALEPRGQLAGYVHVAACTADQMAREWQSDSGSYGVLSWFLTQAMRDAEPHETVRQVAGRARAMVAAHFIGGSQTVCLEGDVDREFLGARFAPRPSGFEAVAKGAGAIHVWAGVVHGLTDGSLLAVRDLADRLIGSAQVTRVASGSARAKWLGDAPPPTLGTALRVQESARPANLPRLRVRAADAELAAMLRDNDWVSLVDGEDDGLRDAGAAAPAVSSAADGAADPDTGAEYELARDRGEPQLRTTEGLVLWPRRSRPDLPLHDVVRREARWRALWRLGDPRQAGKRVHLTTRFVTPTAGELEGWEKRMTPVDVRHATMPPASTRGAASPWFVAGVGARSEERGEMTVLEIASEDLVGWFVSVVSLEETRGINVVWPTNERQDQLLAPGHEQRVPIELLAAKTGDWPLERPVRERYLVVATRRFVDLKPLEDYSLTRGDEPRVELPAVLQLAVEGALPTRGDAPVRLAADDWGIVSVDLQLEQPPRSASAASAPGVLAPTSR